MCYTVQYVNQKQFLMHIYSMYIVFAHRCLLNKEKEELSGFTFSYKHFKTNIFAIYCRLWTWSLNYCFLPEGSCSMLPRVPLHIHWGRRESRPGLQVAFPPDHTNCPPHCWPPHLLFPSSHTQQSRKCSCITSLWGIINYLLF